MKLTRLFILFRILFTAASFAQAEQEPLVIESLECRGNNSTQCSFITEHLSLKIGDIAGEEQIKNGKLHLEALPNFTAVHVYLEKGSQENQVKVVVEVDERNPLQKEFGVAISNSNERLAQSISARFSQDNLLNTGKILDFSTKYSSAVKGLPEKESFARLQYIDPSFFLTGNII